MDKENYKMKNYKLIPLLAVTAFLAGCNVNNAKAKAPSFAKMGKEVEFAEFVEEYKPDLLGAWADHENQHTPSYVMKVSKVSDMDVTVKSGKKTTDSMKSSEKNNFTVKADMNNSLFSYQGTLVRSREMVQAGYKTSGAENDKIDTMTQISNITLPGSEEPVAYVVGVDNEVKAYTAQSNVSNLEPAERKTLMEDGAYALVAENALPKSIDELLAEYPNFPVEQKEYYKFYVNGKVFTVTYEIEMSQAEVDSNTGNVNLLLNYVATSKMQLDASKGESFKFKVSQEMNMTYKVYSDFVEDGTARFKGDEGEGYQNSYLTAEVKAQDVNLKAVDLANYRFNSNMM